MNNRIQELKKIVEDSNFDKHTKKLLIQAVSLEIQGSSLTEFQRLVSRAAAGTPEGQALED